MIKAHSRLPLAALLALSAPLGCQLAPTNPYDCEAPLSAQQPVTIRGTIQAVTAPIDVDGDGSKEIPPPGGCGPIEADHSGFRVVLRGLGSANDNTDVRVISQETNESGAFVFENVPPGAYVVEYAREGFASPPPVSVDLQCGNVANLGHRCALKTAPPPPPTLEPLPSLVGAESELTVRVLDCDEALRYRLWARPEGEAGLFFDDFTQEGSVCERGISLLTGDERPARRTWRVEVTAVDALGNESAPAALSVTRDTLAPAAPEALRAVAGEDRAFLSWRPGEQEPTDDAPVAYLVSYGLVPRAEQEGACAYGRPADLTGDLHDSARFAIEGPSPLLSPLPEQTLSGVAPGTEVHVQVAALDAVGNLSCWSPPLLVRPDIVTTGAPRTGPAAPGRRMAVEGLWRAYALGSGGVALFFAGESVGTLSQPAEDVAIAGGTLWLAAGAQGVGSVALPSDGSLPSEAPTFFSLASPVHSLAVFGGRVLAGSEAGLHSVDPEDPASAPPVEDVGGHGGAVVRVHARGPYVALLRDDAAGGGRPAAVQLASRAPGFPLLEELSLPAEDVALHDGKLWLARGSAGLDVYALDACDPVAPAPCASLLRQGPLAPGAAAVRLAAWDDVMLVGADATSDELASGGLFFFRPGLEGGLEPVGRLPVGPSASVHGVEARVGEVCLTVRTAADTRHTCSSTVLFPVVGETRAYGQDRQALEVLSDGADLWSLERVSSGGFEIVQQRLASGAVRGRRSFDESEVAPGIDEGPAGSVALLAATSVPGLGALALDNGGRLYLAPLDGGDGSLWRVDDDWPGHVLAADATLGASVGSPPEEILAVRKAELLFTGSDVLALLHTAGNPNEEGCFPLVAVRAPLLEDELGQVRVGPPAVERLGDVFELGPPRVQGELALVPVHPFGVLAASVQGPLTAGVVVPLDESCHDPAESGQPLSGAQALELAGAEGVLELVLSGSRATGGAVETPGLYAFRAGELSRVPLALSTPLFDLHRVGAHVLAHTNGQGALLFALPQEGSSELLVPSLSLPSIATPVRSRVTGRGVLVTGGSGGVRWSVLR